MDFATTKTMKNGVAHHVVSHIVFSSVFRISKAAKIMVSHKRVIKITSSAKLFHALFWNGVQTRFPRSFGSGRCLQSLCLTRSVFSSVLTSIWHRFSVHVRSRGHTRGNQKMVKTTLRTHLNLSPRFLHPFPGPKSWF